MSSRVHRATGARFGSPHNPQQRRRRCRHPVTVLHSTSGCRSDLVAEGCPRMMMFESFQGILWYPGLFDYMVSVIFQNV